MKPNKSKAESKCPIQKLNGYGKNKFTRILNDTIRDRRLGAAARGILCYALSQSNQWQILSWQLQKEFQCGRLTIRKAMRELVDAGYARLVIVRKPDGTVGKAWRLRESPKIPWWQ